MTQNTPNLDLYKGPDNPLHTSLPSKNPVWSSSGGITCAPDLYKTGICLFLRSLSIFFTKSPFSKTCGPRRVEITRGSFELSSTGSDESLRCISQEIEELQSEQ